MKEVSFCYPGKNFVVVGASSGIGKKVALELAQAGANVLCVARRTQLIEQMKSSELPGKIIPKFLDVTKATAADWDNLFKDFVGEYGKIDGGVYTAGVVGLDSLRAWNEQLARTITETSFWGMLRFMQSVAKKRFSIEKASFIVFSSVAAYDAYTGLLVYSSAKAAVQTAVKNIAKEISPRLQRINSLSPGLLNDTDITRITSSVKDSKEVLTSKIRLDEGTVEKVSGMVLFLLSNRADWITGTDIVIDGGMLLGGGI